MANTRASTSACDLAKSQCQFIISTSVFYIGFSYGEAYPAQRVEFCAQCADVVCRVVGVIGVHKCLDVLLISGHCDCNL